MRPDGRAIEMNDIRLDSQAGIQLSGRAGRRHLTQDSLVDFSAVNAALTAVPQ